MIAPPDLDAKPLTDDEIAGLPDMARHVGVDTFPGAALMMAHRGLVALTEALAAKDREAEALRGVAREWADAWTKLRADLAAKEDEITNRARLSFVILQEQIKCTQHAEARLREAVGLLEAAQGHEIPASLRLEIRVFLADAPSEKPTCYGCGMGWQEGSHVATCKEAKPPSVTPAPLEPLPTDAYTSRFLQGPPDPPAVPVEDERHSWRGHGSGPCYWTDPGLCHFLIEDDDPDVGGFCGLPLTDPIHLEGSR